MSFKPMLAAEAILGEVKYPKLGSYKANGCRGSVIDGQLYARSLKRHSNKYTTELFSRPEYTGLDGELVVGPVGAADVFNVSASGVGSIEGEPDVRFYVFDDFTKPDLDYQFRLIDLRHRVKELNDAGHYRIHLLEHRYISNDAEADFMMRAACDLGYEGIVLRGVHSKYKFGRSTELEGGFLRLTPWLRSEAEILYIEEGMHNANEATTNELGRTKRSTAKAGMVPTGKAGSMRVRDLYTKVEFSMGMGDEKDTVWFWEHREEVKRRIVKYKFKKPTKDKPRFPQYEGFRALEDMS